LEELANDSDALRELGMAGGEQPSRVG
jgi:hypothetical protein